jgi:membrane associated rhomboid family serine protease
MWAVLALNVAVFGYELALSLSGRSLDALVNAWGLVPREFLRGIADPGSTQGPVWLTPLTSMFLHAGALHLGGNLLYLWIFGDNVEDLLGHARFLVFYVVCGLAAAALHTAIAPGSYVPVVGASGAVSGVLGAYLRFYPGVSVRTLIVFGFFWTTVRVPALVLLLVWFGGQLLSGLLSGSTEGGGVAWWAHVGGFAAGAALARPMQRRPAVRLGRFPGAV